MTNPLDYAKREAFTQATELQHRRGARRLGARSSRRWSRSSSRTRRPASEGDVDIGSVTEVISEAYDADAEGGGEMKAADLESEDSAPIIQLANRIIEDAYISGASDIHIEPMEKDLLIRYRIDGLCQEKLRLPKQVANALVTRLKIMCNLDISERRLPQDGRIVFKKYTKKNIDIDLRVATGPMNYGEKVVMRILDKQKSTLPLPALGFSEENLARYRECIRQPYGMILHCGPTGSGKSMTLYSALAEVNTPDVNIQTAEDPIEYTLPGLNQMQMNRQIGLTFARALRCYLRMDPDIILVGEIRDEETAGIAVRGRAHGPPPRLDPPHERRPVHGHPPLRDGDRALQHLRVARRRLRPAPPSPGVQELQDALRARGPREGRSWRRRSAGAARSSSRTPRAARCATAQGYKGRVGIHELMVNCEELTEGINKEVEVAQLKRIAMKTGMKTLHQDSMLKVKMGLTTVEESLANVPPGPDPLTRRGAPDAPRPALQDRGPRLPRERGRRAPAAPPRKAPEQGRVEPDRRQAGDGDGRVPVRVRRPRDARGDGPRVATGDLHLFAVIAEKAYEGESRTGSCSSSAAASRSPAFPRTSRRAGSGSSPGGPSTGSRSPRPTGRPSGPIYDPHRDRFVALRADCQPGRPVTVEVEEITPAPASENRA